MEATVVADRLYSLTYRPQELALWGDRVTFGLRSAAMYDDPAEITRRHFLVLVLEITAHPPAPQPGQGDPLPPVQVLKVGWELEVETAQPCPVGSLPERMADVRLMLQRIADTLADLARRAGVEPPLTGELITTLLDRYRTEGGRS